MKKEHRSIPWVGKFLGRLPRGHDLELSHEGGVGQAKKESLGDLSVVMGMIEMEWMDEIWVFQEGNSICKIRGWDLLDTFGGFQVRHVCSVGSLGIADKGMKKWVKARYIWEIYMLRNLNFIVKVSGFKSSPTSSFQMPWSSWFREERLGIGISLHLSRAVNH